MAVRLILLFLLFYTLPAEAKPCSRFLEKNDKCVANVLKLRPGQGGVGILDVDQREALVREMAADPQLLKRYLKDNRMDVVISPSGEYHLIDGHHHALAMQRAGIKNVHVRVVKNFSGWTQAEFWEEMRKRGWVRLKDEKGNPIPISKLPKTVRGLKNDPYRSLARAVQSSGAVEDVGVTMAEFEWADFFRKRIPIEELEKDWEGSVKKSIQLSFQKQTENFPGHVAVKKEKLKKVSARCWIQYRELALQ